MAGLAGDSTSFAHGFFHDACLNLEVVLGDGSCGLLIPKPETRNPEPEIPNSEPGICNSKLGTRNMSPGNRNPEPGT